MPATPQSQSIQVANSIISLAQQLLALNQAIVNANSAWTNDGVATIVNSMGTVAVNADGSIGAADGTPNNAHPINPTTYPGFTRAISANQLATLLTILNNIPSYVSGNAIGATGGVTSALNLATGG